MATVFIIAFKCIRVKSIMNSSRSTSVLGRADVSRMSGSQWGWSSTPKVLLAVSERINRLFKKEKGTVTHMQEPEQRARQKKPPCQPATRAVVQ